MWEIDFLVIPLGVAGAIHKELSGWLHGFKNVQPWAVQQNCVFWANDLGMDSKTKSEINQLILSTCHLSTYILLTFHRSPPRKVINTKIVNIFHNLTIGNCKLKLEKILSMNVFLLIRGN